MSEDKDLIPKQPAVDQDVLRQFVENQAQELYIRQQEQVLRETEINNTHEYSLKLLDAQLIDRDRESESIRRNLRTTGTVLTVIVLAIIAGMCYALFLNKDQIVIELVKAIVLILAGGMGGYSIKALKTKKDEPKE